MKKIPFTYLILFLLFVGSSDAQPITQYNFPVEVDGQILKSGWVGGLKSPQFSTGDLDNDGEDDLFIFDKTGNVILTFKNEGTGDKPQYAYRPSYAKNFPELEDWAMLRDYNNDGAPDIFGQIINTANQGVGVWKGRWEGNFLAFDRVLFPQLPIDALPISTGNGLFTQIFVSTIDIPGIEDIDDDGDMDILTFSSLGGVIFHYKNMDVENGNSLETFEYELVDDCWGRLFESGIDGCLELSANSDDCASMLIGSGDQRNGGLHAGSTLAIFDGDDDGDKDLVLGDISFTNLIYSSNNESSGRAWIDEEDCEYPSYDLTVNLADYPAAYVCDLDNDGKRDMVVSSNSSNSGEDRNSVWFYKNTGTDLAPVFDFQKKDFLMDEMIDVGQGANPTLVDFNADGLLDIVVGNISYFIPISGTNEARIQLFLNVGTATAPAFELADDDVAGLKDIFLSSGNIFNFAPTFGDLDGDGDEDLFFGDNSGRITFVENTAGANQPMTFGFPEYNWMELKVGTQSTPTIIDINRDGLLDFVVGEKSVNFIDYTDTLSSFNLFLNTGTTTAPMFVPNPNEFPNFQYFGFVETVDLGFTTGESAPAILDTGEDFLLFSGSTSGNIKVYSNIEDNIYGEFEELYSDYGNLNYGWATHPAIGDINQDGILDMVIGNKRGGLTFIETDFRLDGTSTAVSTIPKQIEFQIFPNPTKDQINIRFAKGSKARQIQIFNQTGQQIHADDIQESTVVVSMGHLAPGMYFLKVMDKEGKQSVEKIVVQ